MESPVVIDKPPEYHGQNERGFPFDEDEASGAWADLAARHPDIAARLRQRPSGWTNKRRPSSQDATDDFDDNFGVRFPFDDIPAEFRDHFPTHWNRRFQREDPQQSQQQQQPTTAAPQQQTSSTQTEVSPEEGESLPQHGLRNTVELGQASAADAERAPRSSSAPPAAPAPPCTPAAPCPPAAMSREPAAPPPAAVRHIPIFVEGRDEPVLPRPEQTQSQQQQTYAPPPQQTFVPPPQQTDTDYFNDDFFPPRNVSRAFGAPFGAKYRQGPQPFTQTKAYPQAASARAGSPRAPSPHADEFVKVPVHHEHRPETPTKQQPRQPPPPAHQPSPPPPPPQKPSANDPITQILSIQTDVLNLMSEVENFAGSKKDKQYIILDEMLTRNLIKLDNIETDGKENIRQARKEAIRCIQKCIAVLEAKAEKNSAVAAAAAAAADVDMNEAAADQNKVGGEEEIKQAKENSQPPPEVQPTEPTPQEPKTEAEPTPAPPLDNQTQPPPPDTRPDADKTDDQKDSLENKPQENVENKTPKKGKVVKKRDKSKDTASSKQENVENSQVQVDNKGVSQKMEVDGAASQ